MVTFPWAVGGILGPLPTQRTAVPIAVTSIHSPLCMNPPSIARFNIHCIAWITHCALYPFIILREKEYQRLLAYGIDEVVSTIYPGLCHRAHFLNGRRHYSERLD